ncbi:MULTISPECIES: LON peptidase substrate-binding domain-containing protein [Ramlibacter]|uniref:LON peptidase substrate-binding domain-containing protein n=1 Tax=Ramlibacter aquaticus TaxID=2780094 RepID=A0ABR9SDA8_9BURK|nr:MULTISPECIES: LON peptidase substrate-binding domain-containing protein [Ramlibacter]MBE7940341.1 LON peptidase substrate-binding domain-containing protein [Ramlibacter aquaticus]
MSSSALTLQSLPLFPLGTVLFPDGVLPLRIFEVRYLDMIGKCRRAGAPFGVVSLTQGHEVRLPGAGGEAFANVGTLATITDFDASHPGLMTLRASGAQRFRITSREQLRHGLWVADVEQIPGDKAVPIPEDLQITATALAQLIHALEQKGTPDAELPVQKPWHMDDCGWVANRWCELLPLSVTVKQRLLELDNPLLRLELVSDVLAKTGIAQ